MAIVQPITLFIPFALMRFAGLFVGVIAVNATHKATNFLGESVKNHASNKIAHGSSGKWEYVEPKWKWLWPWGNDEDGYLGEPSGKWSASVDGNERSKLNMYMWSAIRNPANNFSRYTSWYSCPVNDCVVEHVGTYNLDDNDPVATGSHIVVATHKVTGKKYYTLRIVWKYPFINRVFHVRLGFKIKPSHANSLQEAAAKGWTFRISIAPRIN